MQNNFVIIGKEASNVLTDFLKQKEVFFLKYNEHCNYEEEQVFFLPFNINENAAKKEIEKINKLNKKKNALGIPFKRDINEIKRRLVSQWKMQRKRNFEKKYIMNNTNVTGVPYNLKNNFKLALANYILNNKKGKISKKGIDDYRKYWLKFRSNINNNARPKGINRAVRARIETL